MDESAEEHIRFNTEVYVGGGRDCEYFYKKILNLKEDRE